MGFIENKLHPDRKHQDNWPQFASEVGGIFVAEGASGGDEIHIPYMDYHIALSKYPEGHAERTVLTARYSSDEFEFKIFGWAGHKVPEFDRDPYLNSEFPDLATRVKVELNNAKKLTSLLTKKDFRQSILEAPRYFTLTAGANQLCLDNRAHGSDENGIINDLGQLHAALELFKSALSGMDEIGSASADKVLMAA